MSDICGPKSFLVALFALILAGVFQAAHAQPTQGSGLESIADFRARITVNLDNSVDVTEIITYDTGTISRHGLQRDIYPYSSEGRLMDIENIRATDENGQDYEWVKERSGQDVRIRMGDPNSTFIGKRTYVLSYKATNAVAHPADVDEIYWNVTGNGWNIPVLRVQATVTLPEGITATQTACYYGPKDGTSRCSLQRTNNPLEYSFASPAILAPGEGLTVAVGFQKGTIPAYSDASPTKIESYQYYSPEQVLPGSPSLNLFAKYSSWLFGIILPLLVFVIMFSRWNRIGRDPKGRGVIVPQYDVPDGLTPLEVACILEQGANGKHISAELVYLATLGYIKIRQVETKVLGFIKMTDYDFILEKSRTSLPNEFGRKLLEKIFDGSDSPGSVRKISDLKNKFYKEIPSISDSVVDSMLAKGYYSNLRKNKASILQAVAVIFGTLVGFVCFAFASMIGFLGGSGLNSVLSIGGVVVSVIILIIFARIMPAKTEKGVATKEYILGLKDYLRIAERDRLAFHNAPEKKPEIFEKLLPYAMVLGVDKAWAKEFQDIYITPPNWYESAHSGAFNAVVFDQSLAGFAKSATMSMASAPGSSGGGHSGGGGGGGGGGGW